MLVSLNAKMSSVYNLIARACEDWSLATGHTHTLVRSNNTIDWGASVPVLWGAIVYTAMALVLAPWRATLPAYAFGGLIASGSGVEMSGLEYIPDRPLYIACHHRASSKTSDDVIHFLLAGIWPRMTVALGHHMKWLEYLPGVLGLFRGRVMPRGTEERYQFILQRPNTSVFVDGSGSQYPGDSTMAFREGLFAASMATGHPILDVLFVEAGPAGGLSALDFALWEPPNVPRLGSAGGQQYKAWRFAHRQMIDQFTLACHTDFLTRLARLEAPRLACELTEGVCPARPNHGHAANLRGAICHVGPGLAQRNEFS